MKSINEICNQFAEGRFEFSRHAFKRAIEHNISNWEIMEAGEHARLIEEYPHDKYSPSALLLGFTRLGRPLHLQVSLAEYDIIKIITLYEPDEDQWENFPRRK